MFIEYNKYMNKRVCDLSDFAFHTIATMVHLIRDLDVKDGFHSLLVLCIVTA